MKTATIYVIALLCAAISVFALPEGSGTSGMTFLKMNFSPYASALGGVTAGYSNGPDGFLGNPASMSYEKETSVGTSFGVLYTGISGGDVVAQREFTFGKLGLGIRFLTYGTMDRTDSLGNVIGSFGSTDLAFSVAYCREIANNISLGLAPFFATSSIDTFSSQAIGVDIGMLYKFDRGRGRAGLTLRNLGGQVSAFVDSTDPLPLMASLGASYRLVGLPVYAIAQGDWSNDAGFSGGFGLEIIQLKPLYLRVGYRIRPMLSGDLAEDDVLNGLTAGFGLQYMNIHADYAFEHFGVLGVTHKFAIAYDGF